MPSSLDSTVLPEPLDGANSCNIPSGFSKEAAKENSQRTQSTKSELLFHNKKMLV